MNCFLAPRPPRFTRLPLRFFSFYESALEVLEESRMMATDELKQAQIQFFDNKFTSLIPLKIAFFLR